MIYPLREKISTSEQSINNASNEFDARRRERADIKQASKAMSLWNAWLPQASYLVVRYLSLPPPPPLFFCVPLFFWSPFLFPCPYFSCPFSFCVLTFPALALPALALPALAFPVPCCFPLVLSPVLVMSQSSFQSCVPAASRCSFPCIPFMFLASFLLASLSACFWIFSVY